MLRAQRQLLHLHCIRGRTRGIETCRLFYIQRGEGEEEVEEENKVLTGMNCSSFVLGSVMHWVDHSSLLQASLAHLTSFFWCCFVAMDTKCSSMHHGTACTEQLSSTSPPKTATATSCGWNPIPESGSLPILDPAGRQPRWSWWIITQLIFISPPSSENSVSPSHLTATST